MVSDKNERLFSAHYGQELLRIAKGDLESAEALKTADKGRPENIIFLAQQCVEKALKSVLCAKRVPFPLVHDLGALIAKMPDNLSLPYGYRLTEFNDFAAIRRYEEGPLRLTTEDIETALKVAKEVLEWAMKNVK